MKKIFPYLLLSVVAFFSYHQLLDMYFWRDDYTGLYIAQQGNLQANPIFAYPYQWSLLLDKFAYDLFGLNASYHFLAMVILYIFISWLLFYFLKELLSNKPIAFLCALVFAAGFIGQDDMKMSQDGSNALIALIFLLLSLITLLLFHRSGKKKSLLFSLIAFFLALEISPHRVSSSLLVLLSLDWAFSWKKKDFSLVLRSVLFIFIFFIQTILHPSAPLLDYQVRSALGYSKTLLNFSPLYILNTFGTFWNMIIPTPVQEIVNSYLGIPSQPLTLARFWLSGLPSILLIAIMVIYLKALRPLSCTFTVIMKLLMVVIAISVLWAVSIYQINIDKSDLVSVFNGGMLLVFLMLWIVLGFPKFKLLASFSLLTIFAILGTFFISIPERILVSYHRYLLLPSFAVSLLPIIFITSQIYQKKFKGRAYLLLIFVVAVLVLPRLVFSYSTQKEFKQKFSEHAKRMYQELRSFIPLVNKPTVIYIEGATKDLQFAVGDAARVGFFGSEVAYAVHYNTQKENIILPQTLGEIPLLLKKNPQISHRDVYTFIYDEEGLKDTSAQLRKLLVDKIKPVVANNDLWVKDTKSVKFTPSLKIWTLLPLKVKIPMKFFGKAEIDELMVSWEYNTSGLITEDKFIKITPLLDNLWYEYEFTIPGGGEYLKEISINFPAGVVVEVGKVQFSY